jgi:hypothetical protein
MWKTPNDPDWGLGVSFLRWTQQRFHGPGIPEPDSVCHLWLNDGDEHSEWFPDIAFDFDTGDLYMAYTGYYGPVDHPWKLYYRRFERAGIYEWTYSDPYLACDPAMNHNAWGPSIDVGWFSETGPFGPAEPYVGIAYTAKWWQNDSSFRVAGNFWPTSAGLGNHCDNDFSFENPHTRT